MIGIMVMCRELALRMQENYFTEIGERHRQRDIEIAKTPIISKMTNRLFKIMIALSVLFALAEYFDARMMSTGGLSKNYNIGTSFRTAFIVWTIIGLFVITCCLIEFLLLRKALKISSESNEYALNEVLVFRVKKKIYIKFLITSIGIICLGTASLIL